MKSKKNRKINNKYLSLIKDSFAKDFDKYSIEFEQNSKKDNNKDIYNLTILNNNEITEYLYDVELIHEPNFTPQSILIIYSNENFGIFYIDFNISFLKNKNNFVDCSIKVYNVNHFQEILLFRAEWANMPEKQHAQPHWHFEWNSQQNNINHFSKHTNSVKDFNPTKDFDENIKEQDNFNDKMKKFHFAMNANWHSTNTNHTISLDKPEELQRWVENTIQYIKEQLESSFK